MIRSRSVIHVKLRTVPSLRLLARAATRKQMVASGLAALLVSVGVGHAQTVGPPCHPPSAVTAARQRPVVLYTDIQSGPTSGGESGLGAYLSIFGRNLGQKFSNRSESHRHHAKVWIGGHEVANYRYSGPSAGRPDVEQLTVQVGGLGGATQGRPLPVRVEVDGLQSNADNMFTPNPGTMYFVDNVTGDDATGRPGDIDHPFRTIQTAHPSDGVWPHVGPGDFVVMRGRGSAWQGSGVDGFFLRFQSSGTAPAGKSGTGPITVIGYPGEDVFINETYEASPKGAIAARNAGPRITSAQRWPTSRLADPNVCEQNHSLYCSQWIVIANLRIEDGGKDGAVDLETGGNHWRIVNNRLSASTAHATARSGGIAGDGLDVVILGNTVHDIDAPDPGLQNHGIYIDGPGSYRIDYNYIHDVPGGSGFQVYGDESATGSFVTNALTFSHNWVDHVAKYCINFADNSGRDLTAFDNVLAYCGMAGLRINSPSLVGARVYNNTFYAAASLAGGHYGAIVIDSTLELHALDVRNNIFVPSPHRPYIGGDAAPDKPTAFAVFTKNLYFGGTGKPGFDSMPVIADPAFKEAASCDFHLAPGSGAIQRGSPLVNKVVTDDFDSIRHTPAVQYDVGAYSYR